MIFLIDFENVSAGGFEGIERLTKADKLILFYAEAASKISLTTHRKIEEAKATKEYLPIKTGGKNALDFQLATYLGSLVTKDESAQYCIVSQDTGFDFVVHFWKQKGIKVLRCANLLGETKESLQEKLSELLPDDTDKIEKIAGIINRYKTKQGINNALMKEFGSEKTGTIYKTLRPLLKGKKGN